MGSTIRSITSSNPVSADLYVYLCKDQQFFGTIGIAYLGTMCLSKQYATSINEKRDNVINTAEVVVHEMGHNMGMEHDFDPM